MTGPGEEDSPGRDGPLPSDLVVLHVDDDPDFGDIVAEYLERQAGIGSVRTATCGSTALDRLESAVDCVVSDYQMSGMNGLDLMEAMRDRREAIPFVLFTGHGSEEIAGEAIARGVDDYMQKESGIEQYEVLANRIRNNVARVRSRVNYRELFEEASVPMTVRDMETGTVLDVNEQYCELLGYDREETLELTLEDICPGDPPYTAERARERIASAVEAGGDVFEWIDVDSDGEHIPVEVRLRVAEIGGRQRLIASVIDITERSEREERLAAERDRVRALFENATVAIADTEFKDDEPIVRDVNPAFESTFGVSREEAVGRDLDDMVVPPEEVDDARAINRRVREGERIDRKVTRQTPEGARDFLLRSIPVVPEPTDRAYAVYRDVTDDR